MTESDETEKMNNLLKAKLLQHLPQEGKYPTAINGLEICRRNIENQPENCFYKPSVGIIVQGFKHSMVGSKGYNYGEKECLITGIDIPSAFYVTNVSEQKPFLAVSLSLNKHLITQLAMKIKPKADINNSICKGLSVNKVNPDILDAFLRLLELLDKPEQIPVLAPMIIEEIHGRLLIGPQGEFLRKLNTFGTQSNQIAQAINWLRTNYKEPLLVENLAGKVNMATSTFHRHFKEVTSLSPLQFHKRLRLYEAQRLMLVENENASSAGISVGYESLTQFNREYKRLFGEPPHRNLMSLR